MSLHDGPRLPGRCYVNSNFGPKHCLLHPRVVAQLRVLVRKALVPGRASLGQPQTPAAPPQPQLLKGLLF